MSITKGLVFSSEASYGPMPDVAVTLDRSRFHNNGTNVSITYERLQSGLWTHVQNANTDRVSLGTPRSIVFTNQSFSTLIWAYATAAGTNSLFSRISTGNDGWGVYFDVNGSLVFYTLVGGGGSVSSSNNGVVPLNTWKFLAITRNGTSGRVFCNGLDVTNAAGVHNNPGNSLASTVYIGNWDTLNIGIIGKYSLARIYEWALPPGLVKQVFDSEKSLFGY